MHHLGVCGRVGSIFAVQQKKKKATLEFITKPQEFISLFIEAF